MPRACLLLLFVACSSKREQATPPPPPAPVPAPARPEAWWTALPEVEAFDVSITGYPFEGPAEQRWSWTSSMICGEGDPYARTSFSHEHEHEGVLCGRTLAEHATPQARFTIDLDRAAHAEPHPLFVLPTTFTDLAAVEPLLVGFRREGDVLCRTFDPSPDTCAARRDPSDRGVAIVDGYIVAGSYVALAELIASSERARVMPLLPAVVVRQLELDLQPAGTRWTIGPRRWLPLSREEAGPFAETVRRDARAIGAHHAWGIGFESIVLVPRCATPACPERTRLADAFRTYQRAWAAAAPARLKALLDEAPGPEAECARPVETAMIEQAARTEVTVTDVVELRVVLPAGTLDKLRPASCEDNDKPNAEGIARVRAAL